MWRRKVEWSGGVFSLLLLLLAALCSSHRFLQRNVASQFLTRHRRANSLFEESKKGNLERECIEELCGKEEAREIFENIPETEYFFPKYTKCLVLYRVSNPNMDPGLFLDLRTCIEGINDQCSPLPCFKEGYERCVDGQGTYTCVCKPGWKGLHCEEDIDECKDPEFFAGCKQGCQNTPGSFNCFCYSGYYQHDVIQCIDINECRLHPNQCQEPSRCVNSPGSYKCECPTGYVYNSTSHECEDIDECEQDLCMGECVNTVGNYSCYCDGRERLKLAEDGHSCKKIYVCVPLYDHKHGEILYLGEQFTGLAMIYLHFRYKRIESEVRSRVRLPYFDPEGVMLYAESLEDSWFLLGLRNGRIEVQFKNRNTVKVTSGGKAINDGQWHVISVEELDNSISVKISKEAVMSINNPGNLFIPVDGKLEAKIYIAGLPNRIHSDIKQINPRLDGCIRGWNLMDQGTSEVKEYIQGKESKHCFVHVEKGSYFSGDGMAQFNIDYNVDGQWRVDVAMSIRPSSTTGVLFALVNNDTVPLTVSVLPQEHNDAYLQVFLGNIPVARLESLMLCYPERLEVKLHVSAHELQISGNSSVVFYTDKEILRQALAKLNGTMQQPVLTYIGGLPDLPLSSMPVSAYYHGCMEIHVNKQLLDFDDAVSKHSSINSHSCPPVSPREHLPPLIKNTSPGCSMFCCRYSLEYAKREKVRHGIVWGSLQILLHLH